MSTVTGIVLAGGSGTRMGMAKNKTLLSLCGKSVLARSMEALAPFVDDLIVVYRGEDREAVQDVAAREAVLSCPVRMTLGGDTRQASVRSGLAALPDSCGTVLIHDAARCLVDAETILRVLQSAKEYGSGVAAVPVVDTIKKAGEALEVEETLRRDQLWAVQTPQGFRRPLIEQAHAEAEKDGWVGTDDASLLERLGQPVHLVMGSRHNIKLTTPEDLAMAEVFLRGSAPAVSPLRIGQGYDVHQFAQGRPLILCGIEVPYSLGLDGHSDADVAVHALMDAMLGALSLGDIGKHFPDTDDRYRGISSLELLRHVMGLMAERHAQLVNADITIVAQTPKLAPYIPAMRAKLAEVLAVPEDRVSVKATTTERLGFEGRKEGISSQAVVLMQLTD